MAEVVAACGSRRYRSFNGTYGDRTESLILLSILPRREPYSDNNCATAASRPNTCGRATRTRPCLSIM